MQSDGKVETVMHVIVVILFNTWNLCKHTC